MGTWGNGLYQNDVAEDVRDYYIDKLKKGEKEEKITIEMTEIFQSFLSDYDDAPYFWLALADTQWEYGRLEKCVLDHALKYIESESTNETRLLLSTDEIITLKAKLNSPQPFKKRIVKHKSFHCPWHVGDVYAYLIETTDCCNVAGQYFLIQKVGETKWWPDHMIPIVRVKITKDGKIPSDETEFQNLPYVQIAVTKPDKYFQCEKDTLDDFGYSPHYKVGIIATTPKSIPKKLTYVGCFPNVAPPPIEYVPKNDSGIFSVTWKNFEQTLLDRYYKFNLRHSSIYESK